MYHLNAQQLMDFTWKVNTCLGQDQIPVHNIWTNFTSTKFWFTKEYIDFPVQFVRLH